LLRTDRKTGRRTGGKTEKNTIFFWFLIVIKNVKRKKWKKFFHGKMVSMRKFLHLLY